jgi:hypothetical protein
MHGIPEQYDVAVIPALTADRRKGAPDRLVDEQRMPIQLVAKQLLAVFDRLRLVCLIEAGPPPGLLAALDDPGRQPIVKGIGMHAPKPVLVLLEVERKGIERARGPKPRELALAPIEARLEAIFELRPHLRVDAIRSQDQARIRKRIDAGHVRLEEQLHPQLSRPLLQDHQELAPRHAAEAMPGRAHTFAEGIGLDVIPVAKLLGDPPIARRIRQLEARQRLAAEDHAPNRRYRPRGCARRR